MRAKRAPCTATLNSCRPVVAAQACDYLPPAAKRAPPLWNPRQGSRPRHPFYAVVTKVYAERTHLGHSYPAYRGARGDRNAASLASLPPQNPIRHRAYSCRPIVARPGRGNSASEAAIFFPRRGLGRLAPGTALNLIGPWAIKYPKRRPRARCPWVLCP